MNPPFLSLALSTMVTTALALVASSPAASIELAIDATVDVFDPQFGNALPPRIGDPLSMRLDFDDSFLDLPPVGETSGTGIVPLSFTFSGGGLRFGATSGFFTTINTDDTGDDGFILFMTDAGRSVGVRLVTLTWTALDLGPGRVDFSRVTSSRLAVNQIPAGGFEARIDVTRVVPEPGTALLLALGLAALGFCRRR